MKELVYLDKDFVHSFIAQINHELIGAKSKEIQEHRMEAKENTLGQQYNALNQFEDYLLKNSSLVNFNEQKDSEEVNPGSYIKFTSSFQPINFDVVQKMINDKFIKFLFNKLEEAKNVEVQNILEQTLTLEQRTVFLNELEKTYENMVSVQKNKIHSVKDMLVYIKEAIPFSSFIKMDNCLIPVKECYLSESIGELAFKYGSEDTSVEITLIGKITKKINKKEIHALDYSNLVDKQPNEILNKFLGFPTNLLGGFGVVTANNYIISPVAMYFE
ncbi:hypothetical protein CON65_09985 [Bacillus pseudomycoides]|uniref:Uncharacterized protein n=1 Tax=Bacillus pseudomycoides TaxID=64104 RepID=A0AA91ZTF9_9BACI|nr:MULTISPECIES: hypothetical protein [Bacillus]PEB51066.1 hypothetical protein COO03_19075 [Bacillus sp. AFS098217]PED82736.1 hypothetical protein CON65_09985 [Bacillus pseudomycoides]PEU15585.1 hypothetical protein CN525_16810 [Bacillus sp. AFS014408]PEU16373.1 hypothetical protein CN524_04750 [Bacillus sp. AFS019443]PFW65154.1 hypothetical protein COL20_01480 [Bacillus sp. AFS075034]